MTQMNGSVKGKLREPFFMSFLSALGHLSKLKLQGRTLSVLLHLISIMGYENFLTINQSKIAVELGMNRQNVSRAITTLLQLHIIEVGYNLQGVRCYRLSPEFGWRGDSNNIPKASAIFRAISDKQAFVYD